MADKIMTDMSFKHVMQDVSCVYIGAKMTYGEITEREDVPFKICAIVSKELLPKADSETTVCGHIKNVSCDDFVYKIFKQLKIKVKCGFYEVKVKRDGTEKKKYVSKVLSLEEFKKLTEETEEFYPEEVIFSRISLMGFPL